jgi:outer membrane protein OmpA-like peptidoglycan-associated protein
MERVMGLEKRMYLRFYPPYELPVKAAKFITGVFFVTILTGACSQVPDAINPAEWYRGTVDYFTNEETSAYENKEQIKLGDRADNKRTPPLGTDETFPNLALVDEQARARDVTVTGLPADPERPKYAPAIKRQGAASLQLSNKPRTVTKAITVPKPIPAAPLVGSTQPAPPAMPKPFVAQTPSLGNLNKVDSALTKKTSSPKIVEGQKASQKRLVRQLNEIRSRAASKVQPSNMVKAFALGGDDLSTIVISSQGVSINGPRDRIAQPPKIAIPSTSSSSASRLTIGGTSALGNEVKVATIFYDNGSYKLKAQDKRIINDVARLQKKEGGQFRIVGHASSRTRNLTPVKHKMVNFKISIDRADEIANTLVELGVQKNKIQIAAVSDTQPAYYEFMLSGEAGNRRTEIYLTR